jgi:hypothetical protein
MAQSQSPAAQHHLSTDESCRLVLQFSKSEMRRVCRASGFYTIVHYLSRGSPKNFCPPRMPRNELLKRSNVGLRCRPSVQGRQRRLASEYLRDGRGCAASVPHGVRGLPSTSGPASDVDLSTKSDRAVSGRLLSFGRRLAQTNGSCHLSF